MALWHKYDFSTFRLYLCVYACHHVNIKHTSGQGNPNKQYLATTLLKTG